MNKVVESAQDKNLPLASINATYHAVDQSGNNYTLEITESNTKSGIVSGTLQIDEKQYVMTGEFRYKDKTNVQTNVYFTASYPMDHDSRAGYFTLSAENRAYATLKGRRICSDPHTQTLSIQDVVFNRQ